MARKAGKEMPMSLFVVNKETAAAISRQAFKDILSSGPEERESIRMVWSIQLREIANQCQDNGHADLALAIRSTVDLLGR